MRAAGSGGGVSRVGVLFRPLDGSGLVDGTIGVLLGLYICSHPAANGIDLIFLERGAFRRVTSRWGGVSWLALNGLVMFVGWLVIVAGATEVFAAAARVPGPRRWRPQSSHQADEVVTLRGRGLGLRAALRGRRRCRRA